MGADWLRDRIEYRGDGLPEDITGRDPWTLFYQWLAAAQQSGQPEPGAMVLATVGPDGRPAARAVLLKQYSSTGLVFFTNHGSAKAVALEMNPVASALFYWPGLMRQIRATGAVARLDPAESEAYFRSRPRASQIASWASRQSRELSSRPQLAREVAEAERRFESMAVPMPDWGGYRIDVEEFEFWQGMPSRLHDRARFTRTTTGWTGTRLYP